MSDGLSTINAASLTAAVKSVFQESLHDSSSSDKVSQELKNEVQKSTGQKRRSHSKSAPKKRKAGAGIRPVTQASCSEVESAVISIPDHETSDIVEQGPELPCSASSVHSVGQIPSVNPHPPNTLLQQAGVMQLNGHLQSSGFVQPISHPTSLTRNLMSNSSQQQPSLELPAQVSPLTIKQLLSCFSPLTVDGNDDSQNVKYSLENLLAGQTQNCVNPAGFGSSDMHLEPADTPGHVQIPASLLHNLLQGISNPQLPCSSQQSSDSTPLPSIHHFTSQPLQTLLQNLLPNDSNPVLNSAHDTQIVSSSQHFGVRQSLPSIGGSLPQVTYSLINSVPQMTGRGINVASHVVETSAASVLNQLANFTARESFLNHQSSVSQPILSQVETNTLLREALQSIKDSQQQNLFQTLQNQPMNILPSSLASQNQVFSVLSQDAGNQQANLTQLVPSQSSGVRVQSQTFEKARIQQSENNGLTSVDLAEAGMQQATVQGFPVLLQPAGPNGPLQLIPLNKSVNTQVLKQIVDRSAPSIEPALTTTLSSVSGKEPVSIQPKPANQTLENLLQAVRFNTVVLPNLHDGKPHVDENADDSYESHIEDGPVPVSERLQREDEPERIEGTLREHKEHSDTESTHNERSPSKTSRFCVDCNRLMKEPCTVHNTDYVYMPDTPYLSRARASLPPCFTLQQTSTSDLQNFMGVWCKGCLSERTKFGPVIGNLVTMTTADFNNQVNGFLPFLVEPGHLSEARDVKVLEMTDESVCNWTMFLRFAPSLLEQNCTVFRDGDEFYVVTKTEIKEEELLMWFSAEICYQLGISQNPGNVKLNQCGECGLYFLVRRLLHAHLKSKHPETYDFNHACYVCGKKFKSKGKLNSHMAIHMFMKPHTCQYCQKQFADSSNLKAHIKIHTGLKQYKCDDCGKAFRQKAHLTNHLLVHTGDKKFKCDFCDKYFGRRADLKTHTYSHTHEVSFPCKTCNKVFFKLQNLNKHLKVHSGERNYMCDKCFKGFQTKYHRDRHLKICKEKKDSTYMSLEEVAKLDHDDIVPLKKVSEDAEVM